MINYKTKDIGMTYSYGGKEYPFKHDLFRLVDYNIYNGSVDMIICNRVGKEYKVSMFYDPKIDLVKDITLKIPYIELDDGSIKAHGYEVSDEVLPITKTTLSLPKDQVVDVNKLRNKITEYIKLIEDGDLGILVANMYNKYWDKLSHWPAAVSVHHNIEHGLLLHLTNVTKQAIDIANKYADIDMSLVVAGALLHDIGKIREYSNETGSGISESGKYLDHITEGVCMVRAEAEQLNVDEKILNRLLHIIVSHHGKLEWGSPKVPVIKEAFIVHIADYIDTNMYIFHESYKKVSCGATEYNKYLSAHVVNENIEVSDSYDIDIN